MSKDGVAILSAWYEVATPMFCAGAFSYDVRVRPASLRGVLRWWWRAAEYGVLAGAADEKDVLTELAKREGALFGRASEGGGSGAVGLRVTVPQKPSGQHWQNQVEPGSAYLGYGVVKPDGKPLRNCLAPSPVPFRVDLVCRGLADERLSSLERALRALGLFGGLGARSRRGWGSLALRGLERTELSWEELQTKQASRSPDSSPATGRLTWEALCEEIASTLDGVPSEAPPFPAISAFGPRTRVVAFRRNGDALAALDAVGGEMVRYRSWGKDGRILGMESSERNFRDDHDLMKQPKPKGHPRRVAFGLPHNYGKGREVKPEGLERRASPLLLHVHPLADNSSAVVCTFLPAVFLPKDRSRISVRGNTVELQPPDQLYKPVEQFLDRLCNRVLSEKLDVCVANVRRREERP